MPRTVCRVVCGRLEVIATFWPTRAFVRVDLPALGRPTKQAKPARCGRPLGWLAESVARVRALMAPILPDAAAADQRRGPMRVAAGALSAGDAAAAGHRTVDPAAAPAGRRGRDPGLTVAESTGPGRGAARHAAGPRSRGRGRATPPTAPGPRTLGADLGRSQAAGTAARSTPSGPARITGVPVPPRSRTAARSTGSGRGPAW